MTDADYLIEALYAIRDAIDRNTKAVEEQNEALWGLLAEDEGEDEDEGGEVVGNA